MGDGGQAGASSSTSTPGMGLPAPVVGVDHSPHRLGAQVSNVLLVYAHPDPRSFNGGMLEVAKQVFSAGGHEVRVSDLCAMDFDPVVRATDFKELDSTERLDYFAEQKRAYASGALAD